MRSRLLAVSALTVALAPAPALGGRFDAERVDGSWSGDYTSRTFGTTGVMTAQVYDVGTLVFVNYVVSGDILGCGEKSGTLELRRGESLDAAEVTPRKLAFERVNDTSGVARFRSSGRMVMGSSERSCDGMGPGFTLAAQVRNGVFAGKVLQRFPDGERARTQFKLVRRLGAACDGTSAGDGTRDACCRTDADCLGDQDCDGTLDTPPGRCNTDPAAAPDDRFTCRDPRCP